ncbi:MbnH family di-heme enzyme [Roseomonas sp. AR75]|uniref:MbnH family di-heme enzyme n=1 Tax=Roseomonas sp. AR75 TaxID=2562311 RepID=UPI001484E3DE|nr:MbnH family di-heme enzyme [Roseomonas sp. AR75]
MRIAAILAAASLLCATWAGTATTTLWEWRVPAWVPPPALDRALTAAEVELGRHLFHDARLSRDGTMSCATCHEQARAFTVDRATMPGVDGSPGQKNPMSLVNLAWAPVLTWANPGQTRLETHALIPIFGDHPVEMGMSGREEMLFARLAAEPRYPPLFAATFPDRAGAITLETVTRALAAFQRSIAAFDSPYDRYRWGGEPSAISAAAKRGERLFFGERLECYHCHGGLLFSDNVMHAGLMAPERGFHDTGVARSGGIGEQTGDPRQMGAFRTPSLRNVTLTAPYMHDGSMATLDAVIRHYERGGRRRGPHTSPLLAGFRLSPRERADLIAFLESLTDHAVTTDPRWSDPWTAPQEEHAAR